MKLKIYTDLHFFAPHSLKIEMKYDEDCAYLGDLFDLRNCEGDQIINARSDQAKHNRICREKGLINVAGNHDLLPFQFKEDCDYPLYRIVGKTMFIHGHIICWDKAQVDKWLNYKPEGLSNLKWLLLKAKHALPEGNWSPSKKVWERAHDLIWSLGPKLINKIVLGHVHSKEVVEHFNGGLTLIALPRGMSEIDV